MSDAANILDVVVRQVSAGQRVAFGVIVATRGSTPQVPGTMVCVDEAAQMAGTVGGGCAEADVRRRAHQLLASGRSELITLDFDEDFAHDAGMICGGAMDVAVCVFTGPEETRALSVAADLLRAGSPAVIPVRIDTEGGLVEYRVHIEAPPKLVIAGGGHIGKVLAGMMVPLGFRVTVIDDRSDFANAERLLPPIEPVVGDIEKTLRDWPIDAGTYVVIVTRSHRHDERALGAVLGSPARYIGMIGSRRKIKIIFDDLRDSGTTEQQLERVHAPIGLDIKAVTIEEIAVSIAAELVAVRRADYRQCVEGPKPIAGDTQ